MKRNVKHLYSIATCFLVGSILATSTVHAEEPAAEVGAEINPLYDISVLTSPIHLLNAGGTVQVFLAELAVEKSITPNVGVALIGGVGSVKDTSADISGTVFEAGISPRFYLFGDFNHGMQIGVEALYLHLDVDEINVSGSGLGVGPYVGYKIATNVGFTFEAQLGVASLLINAETDDGSESASDSRTATLLNLNAGWSF